MNRIRVIAFWQTIFSRAVEIQKELHPKQRAHETLSSMHEAAEGLPEKIASFNAAVTEQKERVDVLTTNWMQDLEVRIAQLNELLKPGYRGITPVQESTPTPQSPVQQPPQSRPQDVDPYVITVRKQLQKKFQEAILATATAAGSPLEGAWGAVTSGVCGALAFTFDLAYRTTAVKPMRNRESSGLGSQAE